MTEALQQMAITDMLLLNWDSLRLAMGPLMVSQTAEFIALGRQLADAQSISLAADILDSIYMLVRKTPAADYLRELLSRASLGDDVTNRGPKVAGIVHMDLDDALTSPVRALENSSILGNRLSNSSLPMGVREMPIFYATNRKPTGPSATAFVGQNGGTLSLGRATVSIPVNSHESGYLETPHFWNKPDTQQYFLLQNVDNLSNGTQFVTALEDQVRLAKSLEVLVFLHGFNTTFKEAALRAAQFAQDSDFHGVVVLFSWPSQGMVRDYMLDEDTSSASGEELAKFLRVLQQGPWLKVHLLAHSMGSRVLLSGIADNPRPDLPLGQLVFAAADVSVQVFNEKFPKLQSAGPLSTTSYSSAKDHALWVSSMLHGGPRVGQVDDSPYVIAQMDTIDATSVDKGLLGHGYWSQQQPLIADLRAVLHLNQRPPDRLLESVGPYWAFPK